MVGVVGAKYAVQVVHLLVHDDAHHPEVGCQHWQPNGPVDAVGVEHNFILAHRQGQVQEPWSHTLVQVGIGNKRERLTGRHV